MKIRKRFAILATVFFALSAVAIGMRNYASSKSDPVSASDVSTGMQNESVTYDSAKKITVVGTHQNKAIAYDAAGKKLWEYSTAGSVVSLKTNSKTRKLYCGDTTGKVTTLDLDSGKKQAVADCGTRLYDFDVSADGNTLAISAGPSTMSHYVIFFDAAGKQGAAVKVGATARTIVFANDEKSVIVGTNRSELIRYDLSGKELKRTTLAHEIVSLNKVPQTNQLAVLTKSAEYFYLSDDFNTVRSGQAANTGTALGVSDDGRYTMIGTYEGFFYIFNQKDQKILESRFSNPVSKIFVTSDSALISSYGATVNEVKINDLSVVSAFSSAKSLLMILCILFPAAFIVFLILAVDKLAALFARFLHALVKYKTAYLLLLPTFALLLLFNYYPVVIAFVRSFTDWSKNTASLVDIKFIGFENYKTMFEESYFFTGIKNLVIITLTNFAKTLTVPLLVAELVFAMRSNREKYWFRFLFVLPMVVPGVVSALIWQNIYDPNIGLLNTLFRSWNRVDLARVWLGDPATAIWAIVFMGFPFISAFNFLVYYGGLINIPSSLIEAARVDGSNSFYNFFRIHIPLLGPQFKLLIILTFITSIQDYAGIYLLTGGGPGTATYVPGLELYYNATRFGRYGYACALGVVMFIVILAGSIANIKMQANSEEANS